MTSSPTAQPTAPPAAPPAPPATTAPLANRWTRLVGVDHPIVQEGLGPFRTPRLAAAVSNAGGLGTVSMPGMPEDLAAGARTFREHIEECASLTEQAFAVNIPIGVDANGDVLPFTDIYVRTALEARAADSSIAARLRVVTTSAGFPGPYIGMLKDAGVVHQHKVGSTRQAVKAAEAGVDVVIAAGFEMGGHAPSAAVHTFVLVPSITEAVDVPVLLTGGARDGRGLAAALAMGADGVAMGTRFITTHDNSDWHPAYLQALLDAKEGDDVAFNGVYGPCRGLRNTASRELLEGAKLGEVDAVSLVRHKIESMQRAQTEGDVENSLVLTGQVASAIHDLVDVAEFVPRTAREAADILRALTRDMVVA
ncbi:MULTISPECIES: NAD(P)H-dependent flavin oxidoreductase [unclassified Nocardioides]|uniref:NAD(P)H-dependent flavin oxidoreductase n=1 Tax=unclassified Nocardioides TaxID=2615069 RepID=UPI0009E9B7C6|nr:MULTISPECIES: nitronate monooxygenase family protein [unclassified Nocardioides]